MRLVALVCVFAVAWLLVFVVGRTTLFIVVVLGTVFLFVEVIFLTLLFLCSFAVLVLVLLFVGWLLVLVLLFTLFGLGFRFDFCMLACIFGWEVEFVFRRVDLLSWVVLTLEGGVILVTGDMIGEMLGKGKGVMGLELGTAYIGTGLNSGWLGLLTKGMNPNKC